MRVLSVCWHGHCNNVRHMKQQFSKALMLMALIGVNTLSALPTLQLDILSGQFDDNTETTVATSDIFTVRALLSGSYNGGSFFISAAVSPGMQQAAPVPNFGSVVVDGQTYLPSAYSYGIPPLDVSDTVNGVKNLGPHDIFPTYYLEFEFNFNQANTVAAYNVQDDTAAPGLLYYHDFSVNVTGLQAAYALHFDLYNIKVKKGNYTLADFAPFSHDAESGHTHEVPDQASSALLLVLGIGLLGLVGWARRKATA